VYINTCVGGLGEWVGGWVGGWVWVCVCAEVLLVVRCGSRCALDWRASLA
jgi:hypothetical protein